jgi:hypothetical protein
LRHERLKASLLSEKKTHKENIKSPIS